MKNLLLILLVFSIPAFGQHEDVIKASKNFHEMLVKADSGVSAVLDKNLSYGHSNGWVETKEEVLQDIESGKMKYFEIKEDSLNVVGGDKLANLRFKGVFTVQLNGNQSTINLKVLEVWRKKDDSWLLFARQAVRLN